MLLLKDWKLDLLELGWIDSLDEVSNYNTYEEYVNDCLDVEIIF